MTDLVGRLRDLAKTEKWKGIDTTAKEAAAEIERLRAEVKTQRNKIASLKGMIEDEEEAER